MKTIYDLTKEERAKYKQDYKKTLVGKEQMKEAYRFMIACFVSFILLFTLEFIGIENGIIVGITAFLDIFCTISFIGAIITMLIHEIDYKIWLTVKLQNTKK